MDWVVTLKRKPGACRTDKSGLIAGCFSLGFPILNSNDVTPLPAALVNRGHWRRLCREGQLEVLCAAI
jgi:hypothetical protein